MIEGESVAIAGSVTLFVPCYVDQLRPEAGIACVGILESLGVAVDVRPQAICCGQPFANSGCVAEARSATDIWARHMRGAGTVVVPSSSCAVHLRHSVSDDRDSDVPEIFELCEFLERCFPDRPGGSLEGTVCLHSSCHGLRESSADGAARAALARVEGLEVKQAARSDECCGFGGSFSVTFPETSIRMGEDRLAEIDATVAAEVVATDMSCLLHLEGIARANGSRLRFRHIGELIADALAVTP